MPNDPSYVRLSDRNAMGMAADVDVSKWSISGYDVKPFPDEELTPQAVAYVRNLLRLGVLESASKAEYDEVREVSNALSDNHLSQLDVHEAANRVGAQEGQNQMIVEHAQRAIKARRAATPGGGFEEGADDVDPDEYSDMSHAELQAEAESRGLAKSGNKVEIANRLREHDASNA